MGVVEGIPQHVLEMVALEDHIEEVVVKIKMNTETVVLRMFQKV